MTSSQHGTATAAAGTAPADDRGRADRNAAGQNAADQKAAGQHAADQPIGTGVRGLLGYATRHRLALGMALLMSLGASAGMLAQPLVVNRVLARLTLRLPAGRLVLLLIAMFLASAALAAVASYVLARAGEQIVRDLRVQLGQHLLRMRISSHDSARAGDLLSRASGDTMLLRGILTTGPISALTGVIVLVGSISLMAWVDPLLLGLTLGCVLVTTLALLLIMPQVRPAALQAQEGIGHLIAALERSLRAIRTVKASRAEDREGQEIATQATVAYRGGLRLAAIQALINPALTLGVQGSFLLVLGIGGRRVATGEMAISDLVTFLLYLTTLAVPLAGIGQFANDLQKGLAALERIHEVLGEPTEPVEAPPAGAAGSADAVRVAAGTTAATVRFEDVHFGYGPDRSVLHGVSFEAPAGHRLAIVGPSGAGKSTILALIERFYQADSGVVSVDGVDVDRLPLPALRHMIGYVEQEAPVLAGTLADNVRYAYPDATDEQVVAALDRVGLGGLLGRLTGGTESEVGDAGVLVSGGERQRIAIARALLVSPRVLLLDEATSQLDALNELAMRETIRRVAGPQCTVITVAHRLSTVVDADQIIVLDGGRVAGMGTHAELLAASQVYRDLVRGQLLTGRAEDDEVTGPEVVAASIDAPADGA
jgi:ABC-type multidrug transport system fused ATPase/permease subunit